MSFEYGIYRKPRNKYFRTLIVSSVGLFVVAYFTCNYGVFYAIAMQCNWPTVSSDGGDSNNRVVRAMLLADLHLLGSKDVSCLGKFRSEWKMSSAFQAATHWHEPDAVFILGDLFEKGSYYSEEEFKESVKSFKYIFKVPRDTDLHVVPGTHDLSHHGRLTNEKMKRFEELLMSPPVGMVTIRGVHFVMLSSMALEEDTCKLSARAAVEIQHISDALQCVEINQFCKIYPKPNINYSRPIMIQHFPLYRESNDRCVNLDGPAKKEPLFKKPRDCLSKESYVYLMETLRPRAVFGAHYRRPCPSGQTKVDINLNYDDKLEVTLPTYSWRSYVYPAYYLLVAQPKGPILLKKCYFHDFYLTEIVIFASLALFLYLLYCNRTRWIETHPLQSFAVWATVSRGVYRPSDVF